MSITARRRTAVLLLVLAPVLLGLALAGPAGAQAEGGSATLEVDAAHPSGTDAVHYYVRLTRPDGGGVANATVTAAADGPDGATVEPVRLQPDVEEGVYQGQVTFPTSGRWTVRFTSDAPEAAVVETQEVGAGVGTAETDDGGSPLGGIVIAVVILTVLGSGTAAVVLASRNRRVDANP